MYKVEQSLDGKVLYYARPTSTCLKTRDAGGDVTERKNRSFFMDMSILVRLSFVGSINSNVTIYEIAHDRETENNY